MLTHAVFRIPTGARGWVEHVVVNESDRGKCVAGALPERAIELAKPMGAKTVDLTSRPARGSASRSGIQTFTERFYDTRKTMRSTRTLNVGAPLPPLRHVAVKRRILEC